MTYDEFDDLIKKTIIPEVLRIREQGQLEYAHDKSNVFNNFDRVAEGLETTSPKVLMVYLMKHIHGLESYVNGHEQHREDISGRITDSIVYLMLLWGLTKNDGVNK